jgi:hypothetical protein
MRYSEFRKNLIVQEMSSGGMHALFYSRAECEFSREIVTMINQRNMRDKFIMVCAETYNEKLPLFVTCVPLLYTSNREVLTDDDLVLFVQNLRPNESQPQKRKPQQEKQADQDDGMLGYHQGELSDMFSFIDNEEVSNYHTNYDFVDDKNTSVAQKQQQQQQPPPPKKGDSSGFPQPIDTRRIDKLDGDLERYIAQREAEIVVDGAMAQRSI